MARYVVIAVATNLVVNTIEADESFDPGAPDYIKIQSDVAQMGWVYDPLTEELSPPPPTIQEKLNDVVYNKSVAGVEYSGKTYPIQTLYDIAPDYAQVTSALGTSGARVVYVDSAGFTVSLTGAQIIELYDILLQYRSAIYYARAQVQDDIDNTVITSWTEVEDAFDTAFDNAPELTLTRVTTELTTLGTAVGTLETTVADHETRITALEPTE